SVMPVFVIGAARVLAQVYVVDPGFGAGLRLRAGKDGTLDGEFLFRSCAAMRARDETCHLRMSLPGTQWRLGWAPWPFSSMRYPRAKRSSGKAVAVSGGLRRARRWAKQKPEAGVALKPP